MQSWGRWEGCGDGPDWACGGGISSTGACQVLFPFRGLKAQHQVRAVVPTICPAQILAVRFLGENASTQHRSSPYNYLLINCFGGGVG